MLNNVRKCRECGKLFNFMGKPICHNCAKKIDQQFQEVRKFIYDNPNAGIEEVAEGTEVSTKLIMQFLREGRLELRTPCAALLCEKCSKPITSGAMCEECKKKLSNALESKLAPPPMQAEPKKDMSGRKSADKLHIKLDRK